MTYQEALIITRNFDKNEGKKDYQKTYEEMKEYGEACLFLKNL